MGKTIRKVRKLGAKLDITHQLLKSAGLPSPGGDIAHGEFKALSPEEKAAKKEAEALEAAGSIAPAAAPTAVSDDTLAAREALRKRQLAAAGMGGTQLTGSYGLQSGANTSLKSLLGS